MLIDWFTVGAQVLNFLILVWLMRRFLYKPVLQAIDSREKEISKTVSDAKALEAEAHRERDEFQKKNVAFDAQRAALLTKAKEDAQTERSRLLDEARKESDAASKTQAQARIAEQQSLVADIALRTRDEVFSIARKTLSDLAEASLEEEMVAVFIRRLRASSAKEVESLKVAFQGKDDSATVRSTFALQAAQRTAIRRVIKELFAASPEIQFENSPDSISGIELIANGRKIGWSISEYLDSLENGVSALLKAPSKTALASS